ncbi:unnamed protein product [Acanthoscelides obtectus]|uniref:Uncharacterized protein n=1 Tax=Acanthoscelides obtectus TaxID=200917 RepID=A0A9P0LE04_ACAOB|nr:unnamed protein product [Acanthoscelides obtectus]CAK1667867.1 Insulin-like growth factor-binding protein complex acid labile subunit [Acanthoscelides obtectus]
MRLLFFLAFVTILEALHCDKEFNYYDNYGHGFDVTCQGITKEYLHLLENITISNEITLKIQNSTLKNISSNIFQNIRHIRYLYLEDLVFTFPKNHTVFQFLDKLEHLAIINTNFIMTKHTFKGLRNLKELYLLNNDIDVIEPGAFESLTSLQYLEITQNKLEDLTDIPACELKELKTLNLSRNHLFALKRKNFVCKSELNGMALKLNDQHLNIDKKDYISIVDTSLGLTSLDISFNKIKVLGEALNYLKFVTLFNAQSNKLKRISNADFKALRDLEQTYLGSNLLEVIESRVFEGKENLEIIDISNNKLQWISLKNIPLLRDLNLSRNFFKISVLQNITRPSSLVTLNLSMNKLDEVPVHIFQNFSSLEYLDLSDNHLQLHNSSFSGLKQLKALNIANNNIEVLPEIVFNELTKLKHLDLSGNKIQYISSENLVNVTFLEVLNISFNQLEQLNYELLKNLNELHTLDVAGNKLKYIQYDAIITDLPLLSNLNVKSNLLSCEFLFEMIKFLKKRHISYTTVDKFDYERENVAGIYCENEKKAVSSDLRTGNSDGNILVDLSILVCIVLVIVIIGVLIFKIKIYLKRRRYRADEFELIGG